MRTIHVGKKYHSTIYVIDEEKIIFKLDCLCGDFIHRRIKRVGEFVDAKYYSEPCKHLRPFVERLEKQGYTLKIPKPMEGIEKCTTALRRIIIERARGICEVNGCLNAGEIIHRKIRGSNGGKYNEENCQLICREHNNIIHSNEFSGSKGK